MYPVIRLLPSLDQENDKNLIVSCRYFDRLAIRKDLLIFLDSIFSIVCVSFSSIGNERRIFT